MKAMGVGIVGYGASIPKRRLKVEDVLEVWKNAPISLVQGRLLLSERAVLGADEDTTTLAIEAAKEALTRAQVETKDVGALYLGTCTNPYDSRPSATIVSEALGLPPEIMCADVQFSGKSGTAALQICLGLVASGMVEQAVAIGADTINRHVAPGDLLEPSASAGAVALVVGRAGLVAEIEGTASYCTDLSDSFRLEGERYIRSGMGLGEATIEVGLLAHVREAGTLLLRRLSAAPPDYKYVVFQQPFGSISYAVGVALGFEAQQITPGIVANRIGDCGAASALLGFAQVLDQAKGGDRVLLVSYGFGAGSDAFSLKVTDSIEEAGGRGRSVQELLEDRILVDYATAAKYEYKYIRPSHALAPYL